MMLSCVFACFLQLGMSAKTFKVKPVMVSPKLTWLNPTQNTVSLQKPFCVFDSLKPTSKMKIDVYVIQSLAATNTFDTGKTYKETNGGKEIPYKATSFNVPNCTSLPKPADLSTRTKVDKILNQYLVQIGNDSNCARELVEKKDCNGPLSVDSAYRFKYLLFDGNATIADTEWSEPVQTGKGLNPDEIDTWIGYRSGGGIVVTVTTSVLLFFLLVLAIAMGVFESIFHEKMINATSRSHLSSAVKKRGSVEETNIMT
ncbi:uroplakin-3a [Amia ocellicauda]|uniref:uroplakin-3a n=1 Tax=Amia ocellicauda TaxID=2972642 RepID=UPI0034645736